MSLKNLRGHVTVTTPKFFEILVRGHVWTVPGNTPAEFEAVLELLAFDAQKITGSRDRDHAHFLEIFVRGYVGTVPGNSFIHFFISGNKAHKTTDKRSDIKKHTQT